MRTNEEIKDVMNAYPHYPADNIQLEVLLDIRRMLTLAHSGNSYDLLSLREEIDKLAGWKEETR